jgi:hypothetical protein
VATTTAASGQDDASANCRPLVRVGRNVPRQSKPAAGGSKRRNADSHVHAATVSRQQDRVERRHVALNRRQCRLIGALALRGEEQQQVPVTLFRHARDDMLPARLPPFLPAWHAA